MGEQKVKFIFHLSQKDSPSFGHGPGYVPVAYSPPAWKPDHVSRCFRTSLFFFSVLDESNNGKSKSDAMSVIWGRNKAQGFIKKCEGATVKSWSKERREGISSNSGFLPKKCKGEACCWRWYNRAKDGVVMYETVVWQPGRNGERASHS